MKRLSRLAASASALALSTALVLTGCGSGDDDSGADSSPVTISSPSAGTFRGATYDPPRTLPAVTLTDTSGRPWNLAEQGRERITVVYFGYTNCPDVCPTDMADLATGRRGLTPEDRELVDIVFVTVDPRRDTRPVIREWLDRFDPDMVGLTGRAGALTRAARSLGVPFEASREGGVAEVQHGSQMTAFGRDGTSGLLWLSGTDPATITHDLQLLVDGVVPT